MRPRTKGGYILNLLATLKRLNGGKLAFDLEQAMDEVLRGVLATGAKGEVHLKLKVEMGESDANFASVSVCGEVKNKVPRAARNKQTHYVQGMHSPDAMLSLTRRDPSQPPLPGMEEDSAEHGETVAAVS
jgi:hypothetical protein